jgi:hypothetical protein
VIVFDNLNPAIVAMYLPVYCPSWRIRQSTKGQRVGEESRKTFHHLPSFALRFFCKLSRFAEMNLYGNIAFGILRR